MSAGAPITLVPAPDPIHVAMSKVMAEIRAIDKKQRNQQQNYAFRGIDDVFNELQPILVAHGVWYTPEAIENDHEWRQTKSGGWQHSTVLKIRYRFYGPAGDSIVTESIGESADPADKSTQQAMSQALKSLLLQTFCIRTKESAENDPDSKSPEAGGPPKQQRTRSGGNPKRSGGAAEKKVDPETGEITEPPNVSAAIEKLDQEGRKELNDKLTKANMKLDSLSPAAAKQVVKWAQEIQQAHDKGTPFE
jgi:ERF superfamily